MMSLSLEIDSDLKGEKMHYLKIPIMVMTIMVMSTVVHAQPTGLHGEAPIAELGLILLAEQGAINPVWQDSGKSWTLAGEREGFSGKRELVMVEFSKEPGNRIMAAFIMTQRNTIPLADDMEALTDRLMIKWLHLNRIPVTIGGEG